MKKRIPLLLLTAAVSFLVLITGCDLLPGPGGKTGTLALSIADDVSASILLPDIDLDVASYRVTGDGPDGASFERITNGDSVTVDRLAFGEWTVTVDAFNGPDATGDLIGTGSTSVTVITGETVTAAVTVTPIVGDGFLDLTVTWDPADVQTPSVEAQLLPATGSAIPVPLALDAAAGSADLQDFAVANGYYTLQVQLFDNGLLVAGAVEVARFAAGGTTTGVYNFDQVNKPGGSIEVLITQQMREPLYPTISGAEDVIDDTAVIQLSAAIDPVQTANSDGLQLTWVWYVQGSAVAIGDSYTFDAAAQLADAGVLAGSFNVGVVAFTTDGTRAGSADVRIAVQDLPFDINGVVVTPVDPRTDDTLTATIDGTFDSAQLVGMAYEWFVNGTPILGATTASLDGSDFDSGDEVFASVSLDFGFVTAGPFVSNPVTVINTLPVIEALSVSVAPDGSEAVANTTVSDADGDSLTLRYDWTVDGLPAGTGRILSGTRFSSGSTIEVQVTVSDGTGAVFDTASTVAP